MSRTRATPRKRGLLGGRRSTSACAGGPASLARRRAICNLYFDVRFAVLASHDTGSARGRFLIHPIQSEGRRPVSERGDEGYGVRRAATGEEKRVAATLDDVAEGLGFTIVRVAAIGGDGRRTLQIMVEPSSAAQGGEAGMSVEDCARLSRAFGAVLDVEDAIPGAYVLEVSSPGIERPLTRVADFDRFAGALVRVELSAPIDGRRRLRGALRGLRDDAVIVETAEGEAAAPLALVAKARIEDETTGAPARRRRNEGKSKR